MVSQDKIWCPRESVRIHNETVFYLYRVTLQSKPPILSVQEFRLRFCRWDFPDSWNCDHNSPEARQYEKAALENKATVIRCIREKSLVIIRHFWIRWNYVCHKKKSLFFLEAILPAREINIYVRLIAPPRYDWIWNIFLFDRQTDTIGVFRYARLLVSFGNI